MLSFSYLALDDNNTYNCNIYNGNELIGTYSFSRFLGESCGKFTPNYETKKKYKGLLHDILLKLSKELDVQISIETNPN